MDFIQIPDRFLGVWIGGHGDSWNLKIFKIWFYNPYLLMCEILIWSESEISDCDKILEMMMMMMSEADTLSSKEVVLLLAGCKARIKITKISETCQLLYIDFYRLWCKTLELWNLKLISVPWCERMIKRERCSSSIHLLITALFLFALRVVENQKLVLFSYVVFIISWAAG